MFLVMAYKRFTYYNNARWVLNATETPPQVRCCQRSMHGHGRMQLQGLPPRMHLEGDGQSAPCSVDPPRPACLQTVVTAYVTSP